MRLGRSSVGLVSSAAALTLLFSVVAVLPAHAMQPEATTVPGMKGLSDIWCAPDGACLGVGQTPQRVGAVVGLGSDGPSGPVRPVPGTTSLSSITCQQSGSCIAVGEGSRGGGVTVGISPSGVPGSVRTVPETDFLGGVACPTAATCLVTGSVRVSSPTFPYRTTKPVFVVIARGRPSLPHELSGMPVVSGIDCPTTTTCLAVGGGSVAVLSSGATGWTATVNSTPVADGYPTNDISCPGSSTCYATAAGFIRSSEGIMGVPALVPVSPGGVVGPVQTLSTSSGNSQGISCPAVDSCTVVGGDNATSQGFITEVNGGSSGPVTTWANSNAFTSVSCASNGTCGVVGHTPTAAVTAWST